MKKHAGGRPIKFDNLTIKKLEEAFAVGCSIPEACLYADITIPTFYNWKKKNEQLFNRFELLREKPIILARQTVINKMKEDGHLALKYLERKKKDEFSLRTETDITTQGNPFNSITVTYIDKLEPESDQTSEDNTGEGSGI